MREAWRNVRINLLIFSALLALALLVIRFERAAPFLAEHGETLDYAAGLATGADYDALSSLAPFEIRGRFAAKIGECLGLTRDTYPLRVETLRAACASVARATRRRWSSSISARFRRAGRSRISRAARRIRWPGRSPSPPARPACWASMRPTRPVRPGGDG